jgi:hypothetical protein
MADGDGAGAGVRRDAALTLLVLAVVGASALVVGARLTPSALVVGAGATVVTELLLSLRADRVRAVWARREVQAVAVVVGAVGGVGLALLVGTWVLTALAAALVTYLGILGGSVAWRRAERGKEPND